MEALQRPEDAGSGAGVGIVGLGVASLAFHLRHFQKAMGTGDEEFRGFSAHVLCGIFEVCLSGLDFLAWINCSVGFIGHRFHLQFATEDVMQRYRSVIPFGCKDTR